MMEEIKYNIYIGLLKKDMVTPIKPEYAFNIVNDGLNSIGVIGFNYEFIKGVYKNQKEPTLKISFINTFGVEEETLKDLVIILRDILKQESILLEKEKVQYDFI